MASYRMSRFLCWYFPKANTNVSRMKLRYGTSSVHASSSRVAKALGYGVGGGSVRDPRRLR